LRTAAILLAAGQSSRFGAQNKLLADLHGRALVTHSAQTIKQLRLDHYFAITTDVKVSACLDGYDIITVPDTPRTMAQNIAAGVAAARDVGAECLLIALGDMPSVPLSHYYEVLAKCSPLCPSASSNGKTRMPPACFPTHYFDRLSALDAEYGASDIIKNLPKASIITAPDGTLRDIDYTKDLEAMHGGGLQHLK
jgi:molybdenum cofactor cytidylyltransferase